MNGSGTGAASGTTFNGSAAETLSYNTIGAAPLASPTFTGIVTAPNITLSSCATAGLATTTAGGALGCTASLPSTILPSTVVLTNQSNTYTTGDQSFAAATSLTVPTSTTAAPTASGQIAYNSTSNTYSVGVNGTSETLLTSLSSLPGVPWNDLTNATGTPISLSLNEHRIQQHLHHGPRTDRLDLEEHREHGQRREYQNSPSLNLSRDVLYRLRRRGRHLGLQDVLVNGATGSSTLTFKSNRAGSHWHGLVSVPNLIDTALTDGNCVQVGSNGELITTGGPCGTGSGEVTTTGTPASPELAVFSGASSITNGDLTGDVTTSGTTVTTLAATGVTAGPYTAPNITVDAKGRITAATWNTLTDGTVTSITFTGDGTVLSSTPSAPVSTTGTLTATLNTEAASTVLAGPTNGAYALPAFRALGTSDISPNWYAADTGTQDAPVVILTPTSDGSGRGP